MCDGTKQSWVGQRDRRRRAKKGDKSRQDGKGVILRLGHYLLPDIVVDGYRAFSACNWATDG